MNVISGLLTKTTLKIFQMFTVAFALYYVYDYVLKKPLREQGSYYDNQIEKLDNEIIIKDTVIKKAGKLISELSQTVYDLNQTIKYSKINSDINVSECTNQLNKLKEDAKDAKIDNSGEYFYIQYAS